MAEVIPPAREEQPQSSSAQIPTPMDMGKPAKTVGEDFWIAVLGGSDDVLGFSKDNTRTVPIEGNNDSWRLIPDDLVWTRCHVSPSYFRQRARWNFSGCAAILNLISDPDYNPRTLQIAERITAGFRDRLINDPRHIWMTRRDDVARTLQGTPWLQVPKVMRLRRPTLARLHARIEAEEFHFPAIVRRAGTQSGRIVGAYRRPEDMSHLFARMSKGEYYFTEFVNFRSSDGLFRKMRLFNIGGEIILRHLFVADQWNIHGRMARQGIMKDREDLRAEERRYFEGGEGVTMDHAAEMMKEAARRLKLDYFGMDCSPTEDGRFVLFEANATMNFTPASPDSRYDYARSGLALGEQALRRILLRPDEHAYDST